MADGRITLTFLCLIITCSFGQWQRGLNPPSENGFNDLLEAVNPITLMTERHGDIIQISARYQPHVFAIPFWKIEIEGKPLMEETHTLGRSREQGNVHVSSIEVHKAAVIKGLYFHLSSRIGEVVLELKYPFLKDIVGTIEIPAVYKPVPLESACIEQFIYVKFEKDSDSDSDVNLNDGREVEFTFVDYENLLDREDQYYYHHFLQKNKHFYGMEIELKSEYVQNGSEVTATYNSYKTNNKTVTKSLRKLSKKVHSLIEAPVPKDFVLFHDELGMFLNSEDTFEISDTLENQAIDCAAFGHPKPVVEIYDPNGNVIPATEVTLSNAMTTHVIASLETIPSDLIDGSY